MAPDESLNVIALVSGGKDSFYSILHCLANGHRVVALANLHPPPPLPGPVVVGDQQRGEVAEVEEEKTLQEHDETTRGAATQQHGSQAGTRCLGASDGDETDLNSFMYQTVGHQVIPLYAQATGLPLFRQAILGTAVDQRLSYQDPRHYGYASDDDKRHRQPGSTQGSPGGSDSAIGRLSECNDSGTGSSLSAPSPLLAIAQAKHEPPGTPRAHVREEHERDRKEEEDETESLIPLLRAVVKEHPEANALCTGAILSTYQRTRVESVALHLDLVPLAYLWQYPDLPLIHHGDLAWPRVISSSNTTGSIDDDDNKNGATGAAISIHAGSYVSLHDPRNDDNKDHTSDDQDDAQLLRDMDAAGLEARVVKVASAGLDESFLWENVASAAGVRRVQRALARFGGGGHGSVLGEGGEFETLVVDGPPVLFKGRIVVPEHARRVVREGGGSVWLSIGGARVEMKTTSPSSDREQQQQQHQYDHRHAAANLGVRIPGLLDARFRAVLDALRDGLTTEAAHSSEPPQLAIPSLPPLKLLLPSQQVSPVSHQWCFLGGSGDGDGHYHATVEDQTTWIVDQVRLRLQERNVAATAITNSVIVLRRMADFPAVNKIYGSLFREPNPPSRVTISCGEELTLLSPPDNDPSRPSSHIAVYLTLQQQPPAAGADSTGTDTDSWRKGLHVQSRSYWAPANIGPYSQAIAFPLLPPSPPPTPVQNRYDDDGDDDDDAPHTSSTPPLAISIAGQIPLIPSSMVLPGPGDNVELQIALALQHLWRVGVEMRVQWWSSAVAYFPSTTSSTNNSSTPPPSEDKERMRRKAIQAARAWRTAHQWTSATDEESDDDDDDDNDSGPDLWDRRFNSAYRNYAAVAENTNTASTSCVKLPDRDVLLIGPSKKSDDDKGSPHGGGGGRRRRRAMPTPPVFSAEVDELPRQAGVEWHAHLGFSGLGSGSVRVVHCTSSISTPSSSSFPLSSAAEEDKDGKEGPKKSWFFDVYHVIISSPPHGYSGDDDNDDVFFVQSTAVLRTITKTKTITSTDSNTISSTTTTTGTASPEEMKKKKKKKQRKNLTSLIHIDDLVSVAAAAVAESLLRSTTTPTITTTDDRRTEGPGVVAAARDGNGDREGTTKMIYVDVGTVTGGNDGDSTIWSKEEKEEGEEVVVDEKIEEGEEETKKEKKKKKNLGPLPVIPCKSLWDDRGQKVGAVVLFENWVKEVR
ncbi:hypothetical protein F4778DRAFT_225359 [Xylariomycetidae sp. FL2044]|nr:hypothetical protein F4778DRAFT_225359 [Xylariomycetidae sp. FL2044]